MPHIREEFDVSYHYLMPLSSVTELINDVDYL